MTWTGQPPAPRPTAPASRATLLIAMSAVLAAVLAVGVTLAVLQPWAGGTSPPTAAPPPTQRVIPPASAPGSAPEPTAVRPEAAGVSVIASCQSAPSRDAGDNPTSYEPALAVDGQLDTAWRCDGDGVGQRIQLTFDAPVSVAGIGLVPGLAKTDSYDGTDRYLQNRRISSVEYTFDDGSSVVGSFDTNAYNRSAQGISFRPLTTRTITITILGSVPGSPVGPLPATEKVAISEVVVDG